MTSECGYCSAPIGQRVSDHKCRQMAASEQMRYQDVSTLRMTYACHCGATYVAGSGSHPAFAKWLTEHMIHVENSSAHGAKLAAENAKVEPIISAKFEQELDDFLATRQITSENIGEYRKILYVPWESEWNAMVNAKTAALEAPLPMTPEYIASQVAAFVDKGMDKENGDRYAAVHDLVLDLTKALVEGK